jgi:hypothetical protein
LTAVTKVPLGKLPADAFGMLDLPALQPGLLDGYRALPDLTGMASDAMDELGIVGAVPAALLCPRDPTARLVGRALTVRNVAAPASVPDTVKAGVSGLGEIEAHNLAELGDVIVLQGVDLVSTTSAAYPPPSATARASLVRLSTAACATSIIRAASAMPSGRAASARSPENGGSKPSPSTIRCRSVA